MRQPFDTVSSGEPPMSPRTVPPLIATTPHANEVATMRLGVYTDTSGSIGHLRFLLTATVHEYGPDDASSARRNA